MPGMDRKLTEPGITSPTTVRTIAMRSVGTFSNNFSLVGDIMITEEERKQLGLSIDSLPIQNPRTGEWGYRAGVEVFHQLHCLNLLRQALYSDYYAKPEVGGDVGDAASHEDLFGHVGTYKACVRSARRIAAMRLTSP